MARSFKNKVLIKTHVHFFFIVWCRYGYGSFVIERLQLKLFIGFIELSYLNAIKSPKKKRRYY